MKRRPSLFPSSEQLKVELQRERNRQRNRQMLGGAYPYRRMVAKIGRASGRE